MGDPLRDFAAREAQHAPAPRPEKAMRRCGCGRLFELVTGRERTCDDCDPEERESARSRRMLWLPPR